MCPQASKELVAGPDVEVKAPGGDRLIFASAVTETGGRQIANPGVLPRMGAFGVIADWATDAAVIGDDDI